MPPEPRRSSTLYLPMVKRRHLPWQELLGLEVGEQAVADQQAGELGRLGGQGAGGAQLVEVGVEALLVHDAALAHQIEEFVGCRWRRHRPAFRGRWEDRRVSANVST